MGLEEVGAYLLILLLLLLILAIMLASTLERGWVIGLAVFA